MIDNKIKQFDCYGTGWAFDNSAESKIDLRKLDIGKGYTVSLEHFGILDPILGDIQSETPWCEDVAFIAWLLKKTDNVENFMSTKQAQDVLESMDNNDLFDVLDACVERDSSYYIVDALQSLDLCKENAVFGVTDETYFQTLARNANIDLGSNTVDIIYLG